MNVREILFAEISKFSTLRLLGFRCRNCESIMILASLFAKEGNKKNTFKVSVATSQSTLYVGWDEERIPAIRTETTRGGANCEVI